MLLMVDANDKKQQVAVFYGGECVAAGLAYPSQTDNEIKQALQRHADILCDSPRQTPDERRLAIWWGTVRRYGADGRELIKQESRRGYRAT